MDNAMGVVEYLFRRIMKERGPIWSDTEERMFLVGDLMTHAVTTDDKELNGVSLRYMEKQLWDKALRGFISRKLFRQVYHNLKMGWSAIGDD